MGAMKRLLLDLAEEKAEDVCRVAEEAMDDIEELPIGTSVEFSWNVFIKHGVIEDRIVFGGKIRYGIRCGAHLYDVWPHISSVREVRPDV